MLELDDIQHILLTRDAGAHRPLRSSVKFGDPRSPVGRGLRGILGTVRSAAAVDTSEDQKQLGDRRLHLEWPAGARSRRGIARRLSR